MINDFFCSHLSCGNNTFALNYDLGNVWCMRREYKIVQTGINPNSCVFQNILQHTIYSCDLSSLHTFKGKDYFVSCIIFSFADIFSGVSAIFEEHVQFCIKFNSSHPSFNQFPIAFKIICCLRQVNSHWTVFNVPFLDFFYDTFFLYLRLSYANLFCPLGFIF